MELNGRFGVYNLRVCLRVGADWSQISLLTVSGAHRTFLVLQLAGVHAVSGYRLVLTGHNSQLTGGLQVAPGGSDSWLSKCDAHWYLVAGGML